MIELLCLATFHVDASATAHYSKTITRAQRIITQATGIRFSEVGTTAGADITYVQHDGFFLYDSVIGEWRTEPRTANLSTQIRPNRLPLVLHETLHAIGVDHVADPSSVMSSPYMGVVEFTAADMEALQNVSCQPDQ